ncbi:MAG TPA: GHMP kinase [Methylophilaceae bacterium]|nr:GHMP kinase [Methylophilaceae bacterium]
MPGLPSLVKVATTARLHMGFLDLNGGLGRRFGSIGLALDQPATSLKAWRADGFAATGPGAQRALACARDFAERAGLSGGAHLKLEEAIPEHAGLGSGTQLALAVGVALARLYGLPLSAREIAAVTARGARSGIGIGAFEQGGLLLDGGRGAQTVVPPLVARMDFPESWCVLLIFDQSATGVHGGHEIEAFRTLPEFPPGVSADLCRRVLMQALPAVVEQNLPAFGEAIHEIQCRVGDHFAAVQGGGRYTSAAVSSVLQWLREQGVVCVGQSSWGPTGFAVLENESVALALQKKLETRYAGHGQLSFMQCRARNQGSEVQQFYEDGSVHAEHTNSHC